MRRTRPLTTLVAVGLLTGGCSKLLGITDPSSDDGSTPRDGGPDAEVDSSIDAPPPCTTATTFSPEMSFDVTATGTGLVVAELTRTTPTGRDVAIAVGDGIQIMTGNGMGGFALGLKKTIPATAVLTDDFDLTASADDDLVAWQTDTGTIAGMRQDSTVGPPSDFLIPQALPDTFTSIKGAASGFIDGALRPDLIVSDANSTRVYISSGLDPGAFISDGPIAGTGAGDVIVLLRDVDGNGDDDAVLVNQGTVKLARNSGGTFATATAIGTGALGRSIGFGKFTNDTVLDLMIGTSAGGKLFKQTSPGTFEEVPGTIPEIGGTKMQVLDVNGDGTDDVVVDNRIILQCAGTSPGEVGKFTQVEGVFSGGPSVLIDVNKNGKPDLLRLEGTTLKVRLQ